MSFSTVRDKIMAKVNWSINMFLDCERRNFVVQVLICYVVMIAPALLEHLVNSIESIPVSVTSHKSFG